MLPKQMLQQKQFVIDKRGFFLFIVGRFIGGFDVIGFHFDAMLP
jgi:hypothetical protein